MKRNSNTTPPAVIDTASKNGDRKRQRGPLIDGPEGVTKTTKYYKKFNNACWSCGYDVSKSILVTIASSQNGPDGVGGRSWNAKLQTMEVD